MKTKGYLTAVDLINELSTMHEGEVIPNNEFLKANLFERFLGEEGSKIEKDIITRFKDAIKTLKGKIDVEFYGLTELFKAD